ncbi:MAG: hypothetical protein JO322_07225 [Candidatus Eremiobacteraeota bacterium]|nr:hypothetical protein [Candidatus Eremiobacteraeota bacterium]
MSSVTGSVYLHCPLERVIAYLHEGFAAIASTGPRRQELRARVPVAGIELSKAVLIGCMPLDDTSGRWVVTWEPESGGIYPTFEGELSAREHHKGETVLELDGEYTPPLGSAGAMFDKLLGHRLATDTAQEFLMELAAEMRARYAHEQALLAFGHPPDAPPA